VVLEDLWKRLKEAYWTSEQVAGWATNRFAASVHAHTSARTGGKLTLDTMTDVVTSTYVPYLTGTIGDNPAVAYTAINGYYTKQGPIVHYHASITINTISGGSGDARIALPFTVRAPQTVGTVRASGVNFPAGNYYTFTPIATAGSGSIQVTTDDAAIATTAISAFANGDSIAVSGFFWTDD
jgi:hypothetical protein